MEKCSKTRIENGDRVELLVPLYTAPNPNKIGRGPHTRAEAGSLATVLTTRLERLGDVHTALLKVDGAGVTRVKTELVRKVLDCGVEA